MSQLGRPRSAGSRHNKFSMTTVEVQNVLDLLSSDAMTKFNVHAVQTAANSLKDDVKSKFLERLPAADGSKRTGPSKYSDTLLDAVRQQNNTGAISKSNQQYGRTFVHVLGVKASSSGTFRARFFEVGTSRGIKPLNFLKDSIQEYSMKVDVERCLVSFIQGINHVKGATQI